MSKWLYESLCFWFHLKGGLFVNSGLVEKRSYLKVAISGDLLFVLFGDTFGDDPHGRFVTFTEQQTPGLSSVGYWLSRRRVSS